MIVKPYIDDMWGIPQNFVDSQGNTLYPQYLEEDALGKVHGKCLHECSWSELHSYSNALWNFAIQQNIALHESQNKRSGGIPQWAWVVMCVALLVLAAWGLIF